MFSNLINAVDAIMLPPAAGGHTEPPERLLSAMQQCRAKIQSVSPSRSPPRRDFGVEECRDEPDTDINLSDEEEEAHFDERREQPGHAASAAIAHGPSAAAQGQRRMRATAPEKTEAACPAELPPRKKPKSEDEKKQKIERRAKADALLAEVERIAPRATPDFWDRLAAVAEADSAAATGLDSAVLQQSYARVLARHMRKEQPY